jgi:hypothetical protein
VMHQPPGRPEKERQVAGEIGREQHPADRGGRMRQPQPVDGREPIGQAAAPGREERPPQRKVRSGDDGQRRPRPAPGRSLTA